MQVSDSGEVGSLSSAGDGQDSVTVGLRHLGDLMGAVRGLVIFPRRLSSVTLEGAARGLEARFRAVLRRVVIVRKGSAVWARRERVGRRKGEAGIAGLRAVEEGRVCVESVASVHEGHEVGAGLGWMRRCRSTSTCVGGYEGAGEYKYKPEVGHNREGPAVSP